VREGRTRDDARLADSPSMSASPYVVRATFVGDGDEGADDMDGSCTSSAKISDFASSNIPNHQSVLLGNLVNTCPPSCALHRSTTS
jgi:hypothetical protein